MRNNCAVVGGKEGGGNVRSKYKRKENRVGPNSKKESEEPKGTGLMGVMWGKQ